ncbi:MAG TPA: NAD+ synthase [Pyrinomonadaceae bacterium]|nr:NAD+ synthase [Pyrinomonadaceae bacterium]
MRVTIGQINTTNGDYEGNVAQCLRAIEQARADGSDLVVMPEVAVQGYMSFDWFMDRDVIAHATDPLEQIVAASKGLTVIVGTVRPNESAQGRRLYNSAAVISDGQLVGYADKTLLPEYDVFDDPRYFEPAHERRLFDIKGTRVGVAVCEDMWNDKTYWRERLYANDPTDDLIAMGAELIISINASPFNKSKMGQRCSMVSHRAKAAGVPIVFVNLVGANDGVIFDGASIVTDGKGQIIMQAPPFKEFYGSVDLDCDTCDTYCLPGDDIETVHDALVLGIRDYARKNRFTRAVLGLSGGIDSSLVAVLACEALGAENVLSVMMPSPFSSRGSVDDSVALGKNLGMPTIEHPISAAYEVLVKQLRLENPGTGLEEIARQNTQSRLRGNILMAISNAESRLLLSTGNKSELALGYCTLYGDTNGGLAVLGDVLKTEVWALSRYVNREREIIPNEIIEKRPSAELAPGQFDDQSLPPYDLLDPILKLYFERKATPEEIVQAGHDQHLIFDVLNRVEAPANEFKRRQLPPTLIISRHAIGIGRRRPVTHRYRRQVLKAVERAAESA